MNFGRIGAIARKEFLHVLRDPRSLGMGIVIPVIMLILFGYALTVDVDRVPMIVWDQSDTEMSRDLVSRFRGSRYFSVVGHVRQYADLEREIDSGRSMVALVIPRRFADDLQAGQLTPVQLIVDGSDANTATLAIGYADAVTFDYTRDVAVEQVRRIRAQQIRLPLDVQPRTWFNDDRESRNFIIPGLIAIVMMVIAALLTSLTMAREWERGTMEQLISTPVRGYELILGKLIPYYVIGMFDVFLSVLMSQVQFHVPLRGSLLLLFAVASIFLIGVLSMGMLISIVTKSQLVASQVAMVTTFLPSFLLSGFLFAISNMPQPIQVVTHIVPARYFVAILRGIYLKGVGPEILAGQIGLLSLFSMVMLVLCIIKFNKKLAA